MSDFFRHRIPFPFHTGKMTTTTTVQRVSSYTLLMDSGRILLCRLSPHISPRGEWTLPGGGIEFGEHPEETAVREVREETGFEVQLTGLAHVDSIVFNVTEGKMHAIRFIYRAKIIRGDLTHESDGSTDRCEWFPLSEARRLPLVTLARLGIEIAFRPSSSGRKPRK
jgi:8-oxo-dGTP diphosphatase